MTPNTESTAPLDGESLLIRFTLLVLIAVVGAVAASAIGETWAIAAALALLVVALARAVVVIARYLRAPEDPSAA